MLKIHPKSMKKRIKIRILFWHVVGIGFRSLLGSFWEHVGRLWGILVGVPVGSDRARERAKRATERVSRVVFVIVVCICPTSARFPFLANTGFTPWAPDTTNVRVSALWDVWETPGHSLTLYDAFSTILDPHMAPKRPQNR